MPHLIGAIDQGTTSTRFIVFDRAGAIVAMAQKEHGQIYPQPGWVEHDPVEIWEQHADCRDRGAAKRRPRPERSRRDRHHQPARDDAALGSRDGRARLQCDRLAGYARRPLVADFARAWRAGPLSRHDRPAACELFQRRSSCAGFSITFRAHGRAPRRASWLFGTIDSLADVEPDRRRGGCTSPM